MTDNAAHNLPAILESMLFVHGDAIALARLAEASGATEAACREALARLARSLEGRGIVLMEKDGAYQLGSLPGHAPYVEALAKSERAAELSRPALETLAVVAYQGPTTRARIEYIRGVNSSYTLRGLLMRGLIERVEHPAERRAALYRISMDALKHLGLAGTRDLPRFDEFSRETPADDSEAPSESPSKI